MAILTHSSGGARAPAGRYGPSRKPSAQETVFGFTAAFGAATVRTMPSMTGGSEFGLLQYVGHARPE
jgi:hypothetical protein